VADQPQLGQGMKGDAYRLIRACSSSLEEAAALLDAEPFLIDARTGIGETLLHYLAVEDHFEGVRFLHQRGASLDVTNAFEETPLKEALSLGNAVVAGYLLDHQADVHRVDTTGESTLHGVLAGATRLLPNGSSSRVWLSIREITWTRRRYVWPFDRATFRIKNATRPVGYKQPHEPAGSEVSNPSIG
jgi:hypothetical protein